MMDKTLKIVAVEESLNDYSLLTNLAIKQNKPQQFRETFIFEARNAIFFEKCKGKVAEIKANNYEEVTEYSVSCYCPYGW